jgi:hypothetical protein
MFIRAYAVITRPARWPPPPPPPLLLLLLPLPPL